eukprot:CAMPEP_0180519666 /NCGR_PEP_ID=MMETSP1036_2-20121128/55825_1 /TAXON_ID=632150 /ORGANISM="Azadinium spinosum, Strain 3D9" /LENGTH=44 /DNA_ID= /DNA_START= /DNA_END= /DNA_ORIENTATION=
MSESLKCDRHLRQSCSTSAGPRLSKALRKSRDPELAPSEPPSGT